MGQFAFNSMMTFTAMGALLFGPICQFRGDDCNNCSSKIGLTSGMFVYQFIVMQPKVSTLVPPPPMATGGTCVPKENPTAGGINCNQDAPDNTTGIDKANFVRLANQWHTGKNYAEECFNDVVNRSQVLIHSLHYGHGYMSLGQVTIR
jgi:hypothetical protein